MTARRNGAGSTPAPKRRSDSGKNLHRGVLLRAPERARHIWRDAAQREGLPLSEWARQTLTATAAHDLGLDVIRELQALDDESE